VVGHSGSGCDEYTSGARPDQTAHSRLCVRMDRHIHRTRQVRTCGSDNNPLGHPSTTHRRCLWAPSPNEDAVLICNPSYRATINPFRIDLKGAVRHRFFRTDQIDEPIYCRFDCFTFDARSSRDAFIRSRFRVASTDWRGPKRPSKREFQRCIRVDRAISQGFARAYCDGSGGKPEKRPDSPKRR